jgi:hypothetical protein
VKIRTWTLKQQVYRDEEGTLLKVQLYGIYEDMGLTIGTSKAHELPKIPRPEQVW